jgi:sugar transferase (PEP-CTERM/EpsH1 system associated)
MSALAENAIGLRTMRAASEREQTRPKAVRQTPLRVLHVLDHLDTGGTEYGVLKVLNGLPAQLFDGRICVMRGARADLVASTALNGRIFYAGAPNRGAQFGIARLARVFRDWQPHIVHSRNWGAIEAIPAARWAKVPIAIHSEHGYELEMLEGLPLRRRLLRRFFYPMADAIFAVTRDLSAYHARQVGWSEEKIATIYNGVDTERFAPRPAEKQRIREELQVPEGRFVIGAVGRLVPIKNYSTLLRAARELLAAQLDISVVIIGSGPELYSLEREAAGMGDRVRFLGQRTDLPALFDGMDAFAQTSICEGMSNTILEAMASAVPVVATDVGGNPEIVSDETTGLLFQRGDFRTLAAKFALLATNPALCRKLGDSGRRRAQTEFGLDNMMARYKALYMNLAAKRGLPLNR